mmetsp:Transcript_31880/g.62229  ORF Transcript_31880/g.62229 Transcript_31880/m.62229 type:complete len:459 (+) Transcript_31880:221-1597(+)|eukprot:CAMPEP_0173381280 /NCGR_PEP_ID=MMETSP1356-20130122/3678_1 /TAXON_ID=77927 ORGANISM="Hemiselmis virescens, Strain PCC157" /NCGR_SAMPLE_ID=MMETSP1356 /ASSEMBLY_ACC=CAM_ASM_000847 /LENGTH=458 /DNA_ID=CAMNT_0014335045 /DNA_START=218 /DNA_END=1594 /DNA_ORIENTATION=-
MIVEHSYYGVENISHNNSHGSSMTYVKDYTQQSGSYAALSTDGHHHHPATYSNHTPSSSFQYIKDLNHSQVASYEPIHKSRTQYQYPQGPQSAPMPQTASQLSAMSRSFSSGADGRPYSGSSTASSSDGAGEANEIRMRATAWARSEGFTKEQLTEFDHLMGMACSTHINKHQLLGMIEIDRGSFGKIFMSKLGSEKVAVKQLGQGSGQSTLKAKMRELLLELRVLVRIQHPNVVKFHGTATDFNQCRPGRQPYVGLVFEFCERGSLHKALFEDPGRRLSPHQKLSITSNMALGLSYLHSKRIIHRDLNTRNILLNSDLTAKIADFGCARVMSSHTSVLKTTTISGSPAYMAPEQMTGEPLTEAVDVWALAVMLWEVMMDTKPWEGRYSDFAKLKQAILKGEKLHLPSTCHPFPQCYLNAIKLGMQTRAADRPSMALMQRELTNAFHSFHVSQKTTSC